MLGADLIERADNAALHNRPETFNDVGMKRAHDVFALGVVYERMRELSPELGVTDPAISAEPGDFMGYRRANE